MGIFKLRETARVRARERQRHRETDREREMRLIQIGYELEKMTST